MKKATLVLCIIAFSFYSCGKSEELENCETNLEQTQKELESTKTKYNQLVNEYNELLDAYNELHDAYNSLESEKETIVSESKSDINDIIRKLNWNSYNSKDEITTDLKDIEVMNH